MKKPRKPKPVHLNAVQRAIESSRKLQPEDVRALKEIMRESFEAFRRGEDCENHWRAVADACNIAEALMELGICTGPEANELLCKGHAALSSVARRYQQVGSWALRAEEMQALESALWLHGIQLEHASLGEYERAVKRVANKVAGALAGNAGNGTKIVSVVR